MVQEQIKRLTSEPAIFLLLGFSLILFRLTFEKQLATDIITIFGFMLLFDWALTEYSGIRSVSGNSAEALLWAGGALAVLFVIYQGVTVVLRQSVLPLPATNIQLSQSVFQTVYQSLIHFSGEIIDFSQLRIVKIYLFGFVIPMIETRVLARMYGTLGNFTNINISNFKSVGTWSLVTLLSIAFMWFHLQVRGINNNIDLVMTLLFAVVSLYLVGKFREVESAAELHVGWNMLALFLGK